MKEKIYLIGAFLAAVLIFGTAGGADAGTLTLTEVVWQACWALVLGLWCSFGIWLEEARAAVDGRVYYE